MRHTIMPGYNISRLIFDHGFAPNVDELANIIGLRVGEVEKILQAKADSHALVVPPIRSTFGSLLHLQISQRFFGP